jgi:hypothetical protein
MQPGIWERASERLNRAGELCKAAGLQLAYHNHFFEFASIQGNPKRPYDILLESTEPALVSMQMDLCWFIAAGQDPATYFQRHPGRYSSVHVKDLKRLPIWTEPIQVNASPTVLGPDLADVGQGVIDWPTTLAQCWSAGIRHYYVEHDSLQVGTVVPVDTVARADNVKWQWTLAHPHLSFPADPSNTLYLAAERLSLPGRIDGPIPGYGTFEFTSAGRRLTAAGAKAPSEWVLPAAFLPRGRPALSHHEDLGRWSDDGSDTLLRAASRGQEFVLDLARYPDVTDWLAGIIGNDDQASSAAGLTETKS